MNTGEHMEYSGRLLIQIETSNAAFDDDPGMEIARILRELADTMESRSSWFPQTMILRDVNGNKVGAAEVTS